MSATFVKDTRDPPGSTHYGTVEANVEEPREPILPVRQYSGKGFPFLDKICSVSKV